MTSVTPHSSRGFASQISDVCQQDLWADLPNELQHIWGTDCVLPTMLKSDINPVASTFEATTAPMHVVHETQGRRQAARTSRCMTGLEARLSEHGCFGGRVSVVGARFLHEVQERVQRHGRQQRLVVHHVGRLHTPYDESGLLLE